MVHQALALRPKAGRVWHPLIITYRSMTRIFTRLSAILIIALYSCVGQAEETADQDIETLLSWLQGTYSNQAQIDSGVLEAETDLLFPVFQKVDVPAFGSHVVYLQWPIGAPDGRLQRQRIWVFERGPDGLAMDFFTLKEPERWLDAHLHPESVRAMTKEDTIGYPRTCLLPVRRTADVFTASIPSTCEIVSQGTKISMTLQSNITISENEITYREGGQKSDGTVVFKVPASAQYEFSKIKD